MHLPSSAIGSGPRTASPVGRSFSRAQPVRYPIAQARPAFAEPLGRPAPALPELADGAAPAAEQFSSDDWPASANARPAPAARPPLQGTFENLLVSANSLADAQPPRVGAPMPSGIMQALFGLPSAAGVMESLVGARPPGEAAAAAAPRGAAPPSPPLPDMGQLFETMFGAGPDGGMPLPPLFFEAILGSIMSGLVPPDNSTAKATIAGLPHLFLIPDGNDSSMPNSLNNHKEAGEQIASLNISEIKRRLAANGVKYCDFIEKAEFVQALKTAEETNEAPEEAELLVAMARERPVCISECFGPGADRTCTVCVEDFKEGQVITQLPGCGHWFHLGRSSESASSSDDECCPGITKWLEKQCSCPNCKSELPKERDAAAAAAAAASNAAAAASAAAMAADASWSVSGTRRRAPRRSSSSTSASPSSLPTSSSPRNAFPREETPSPSAEPGSKRTRHT